MDGVSFFFFSPRHRTCWKLPHLQHHLSVATHASHVAIPHVSYEDCGSLAMRKGEGSDLVSWCIIKKYQVIGQNMLFLAMFFMFLSCVHHLHRSSPSFLLTPSYILPHFCPRINTDCCCRLIPGASNFSSRAWTPKSNPEQPKSTPGVMENVQGTSDINELLKLIEIRPVFFQNQQI